MQTQSRPILTFTIDKNAKLRKRQLHLRGVELSFYAHILRAAISSIILYILQKYFQTPSTIINLSLLAQYNHHFASLKTILDVSFNNFNDLTAAFYYSFCRTEKKCFLFPLLKTLCSLNFSNKKYRNRLKSKIGQLFHHRWKSHYIGAK